MKTINLIGAGRLGTALGKALQPLANYRLLNICNRSLPSANAAQQRIGEGLAIDDITKLKAADITFITTPDDAIADSAKKLAETAGNIKPSSIFVHMSGVHGSELLLPLKEKGGSIASIHPLSAFSEGGNKGFSDITCTIEADDRALRELSLLFKALGAKLLPIQTTHKALYHSAAVFASNFAVTLHHIAYQQLIAADIDGGEAMNLCSELMRSAINNIDATNHHANALTGPIKRNDIKTIKKHLSAQPSDQLKQLYLHLLEQTKSLIS